MCTPNLWSAFLVPMSYSYASHRIGDIVGAYDWLKPAVAAPINRHGIQCRSTEPVLSTLQRIQVLKYTSHGTRSHISIALEQCAVRHGMTRKSMAPVSLSTPTQYGRIHIRQRISCYFEEHIIQTAKFGLSDQLAWPAYATSETLGR
jgi:hypothetical protein